MATSASRDFILTLNDIVEEAYKEIGKLPEGHSLNAHQYLSGKRRLNVMKEALLTDGIRLWTKIWQTQTLTARSEVLGTDGVDYECVRNHTSAAATVPVTGANYSTYWKEESTTAAGAHALATAYTGTNNFTLPTGTLDIDGAFWRLNETDYPVKEMTESEYQSQVDKAQKSDIVTHYWLKPGVAGAAPEVFLWPYPDDTDAVFHYNQVIRLQDFDVTTDNPDAPAGWYETLILGLAHRLAPSYSLPIEDRNDLERRYNIAYSIAKGDDQQGGDLQIGIYRS